MALYVTDHDAHPAARQGDDVVPVAADLPAAPRRVVAHGDLGRREPGNAPGQHRGLEPGRELPFLVEENSALQRLGDDARETQAEVAVLRREAAAAPVEERQTADGAGLRDQRQEGRGVEPHPLDVRAQPGKLLREVVERGDEPGLLGEDRLGQRQRVVDPMTPEVVEYVRRVPGQRDEFQCPARDQAEDEPVGTEAFESVIACQDRRHVVDGDSPGQRVGGALDHGAQPCGDPLPWG